MSYEYDLFFEMKHSCLKKNCDMIKPEISHYITYIYSGIFGLAAPDENLIQWISISAAGGGRVVRVKLVRVVPICS